MLKKSKTKTKKLPALLEACQELFNTTDLYEVIGIRKEATPQEGCVEQQCWWRWLWLIIIKWQMSYIFWILGIWYQSSETKEYLIQEIMWKLLTFWCKITLIRNPTVPHSKLKIRSITVLVLLCVLSFTIKGTSHLVLLKKASLSPTWRRDQNRKMK